MATSATIRLGVDVGGTFTDVVLVAEGAVTTAKVPTTDDQSEGVIRGIEAACERGGVDLDDIDQFRHAMTVGTNAMLEGTGATTALVTTDGFGDVLAIGRQDRPSLYDISARKPAPLVPPARRYEIDERATHDGIERRVDEAEVEALAEAIDDDVESVAVSLLHAYAEPANERRVTETLRDRLDALVVPSHETLPAFREYERTATTAADAAVTPVIAAYLARLADRATARGLPGLRVMQSNGGIADVDTLREHAITTVLSGPAAGVVGASQFENETHSGIITFDMGGTSSDVGLVRDGEVERTTTASVGGHPVHVPMVDIETVGAGGGSVAWVDEGGALRVGPRSAGADPGPACYGHGGTEPTVTDATLLLGTLGPGTELGDGLTLDRAAAREALEALAAEAALTDAVEAARGVRRVVDERMARAIRTVTAERGYDPGSFALVAYGGAGPMHAAGLADRLGIGTVIVPPANGVLSAFGLLAADERHDTARTYRAALAGVDTDAVERRYASLETAVLDAASNPDEAVLTRRGDFRYAGQSHELTVPVPNPFEPATAADRFHTAHERSRGYRLADEPVELVTLRVTARRGSTTPSLTHDGTGNDEPSTRRVSFADQFRETKVYSRSSLPVGRSIDGPAIFEGGESTTALPPEWRATVDERGALRLEVRG